MWIWRDNSSSSVYYVKTYSGFYHSINIPSSDPLTFTSSNFLGWYTQYFTNSNTLDIFTMDNNYCYYIGNSMSGTISGITLKSGLLNWVTNTVDGIPYPDNYELRVEEITYSSNYLYLPFYWGYDNPVYSSMQPYIYIYL